MDDAPRVLVAGGFVGNYPPEANNPLWDGERTGYWVQHPGDAGPLIAAFRAQGVDLVKAGYVSRPGYPSIIVAATRHGAEALGLDEELGTLETGKRADLVVLDADPLDDIAHVNHIAFVMLRGRLVSRRELPSSGRRRDA